MPMNPPLELTTRQKATQTIGKSVGRHIEVVLFALGVLTGAAIAGLVR